MTKLEKKLKKRLIWDVAYTYRRFSVDLFYFTHAQNWNKDAVCIDVGGKKTLKKGDFILEDYINSPIYVNIDANVSPDYVCDAANMPFEDNYADIIICSEMLEHVPNPVAILKEMKRVLKPGGTLYICVPFSEHIHGLPYDYGRYTFVWWNKQIEDLGFICQSLEKQGGYFATRLNMNKRHFKFMRRKNRKNPFLVFPYLYFALANSILFSKERHSKLPDEVGYTTGYGIVLSK